ncbi:MAG: SLC13 family permease [Minisyncoccia bacterium]
MEPFILGMVLVFAVFPILCAVYEFRIGKVSIGFGTASLVSLVLLFVFGIFDIEEIQRGLIGNEHFSPWKIIVIFMTVAYVSVSTDATGIFSYLAAHLVRTVQGNGLALFSLLYVFAFCLSVFTSNDIVILTLTPIILYLGHFARLNVLPYLFAEFFAANSVDLFFTGNPTDLVVADALNLGFWEYTSVMWLPAFVAVVTGYGVLRWYFHKDIHKKFSAKLVSPVLIARPGQAWLHLALLLSLFLTLSVSGFLGVELWVITLTYAVLFLVLDGSMSLPSSDGERKRLSKTTNEIGISLGHMPWSVLPFIVFFFVLVEMLSRVGVVDMVAAFLASLSSSPAAAIVVMGTSGLVLANIVNNQPMIVFLSSVLVSPAYALDPEIINASGYALAIAGNLGANISLLGALAGLMWRNILASKDIKVSYMQFLRVGLILTPLISIASFIALYITLGYAR